GCLLPGSSAICALLQTRDSRLYRAVVDCVARLRIDGNGLHPASSIGVQQLPPAHTAVRCLPDSIVRRSNVGDAVVLVVEFNDVDLKPGQLGDVIPAYAVKSYHNLIGVTGDDVIPGTMRYGHFLVILQRRFCELGPATRS